MRRLHFFFQVDELLLHRGGEASGFLDARLKNIAQVGVSDGVGDISGDLGISIPVSDGEQVGVGIAFDLEMFQ